MKKFSFGFHGMALWRADFSQSEDDLKASIWNSTSESHKSMWECNIYIMHFYELRLGLLMRYQPVNWTLYGNKKDDHAIK